MSGILSASKADVFHRDISRRNLVTDRQEVGSIGKGCVIDFDCAAFQNHKREAVAALTVSVWTALKKTRTFMKHSGDCAVYGDFGA